MLGKQETVMLADTAGKRLHQGRPRAAQSLAAKRR